MLSDFHDFLKRGCEISEVFKYWNNVLTLINIEHELIRGDRTGEASIHIKTLKKAIPIFNSRTLFLSHL